MAGAGLTLDDWRASVPSLLADCAAEWGLTPGDAYVPGLVGHVVQVELPDGTPAVLKLAWPHREAEQEADALERWDGEGAVRLLARDDDRNALLLERAEPGTFLAAGAGDPLGVMVELLPRLWQDATGFRTLEEEAELWLEQEIPRVADPRLRDAAAHYLRELAPTQGDQVLLHQDLHGENVLAAQREPWLVIDPKPLAGEREFAVAPIVRSSELGATRRDVLYRFDRLTAELGLDRERARGWTVAQTVAWSGGDVARWLL